MAYFGALWFSHTISKFTIHKRSLFSALHGPFVSCFDHGCQFFLTCRHHVWYITNQYPHLLFSPQYSIAGSSQLRTCPYVQFVKGGCCHIYTFRYNLTVRVIFILDLIKGGKNAHVKVKKYLMKKGSSFSIWNILPVLLAFTKIYKNISLYAICSHGLTSLSVWRYF